jgi:ribonuclease J
MRVSCSRMITCPAWTWSSPISTFLRKNREKIEAVILTHGHEDHIGAMPFLLKEFPVRVFGTAFTLDLLREKLKEHILPQNADLQTVIAGETRDIGPFSVEFIRVNHSIVDGVGLALKTPEGIILHSGDFRIDPTPVDDQMTDLIRFAHYGQEGVLAFFSDSTNAEKEGYTLSERDVKKTLRDFFLSCPGRLIVASFASNITRIQEVISLAEEFNRRVIFNGKSMITNVGIARARGFLDFPEDLEITEKQMQSLPDREVVVITTGSQGEPMSALSRMAREQHKGIKIHTGDTIILSSRFIPGNEKAITSVINKLYRLGANVIYENVSDIHTSGHARQAELKVMLSLVKPQIFYSPSR